MTINDSLAQALSMLLNAQKAEKKQLVLSPASKMLREVLKIFRENGYIGQTTETPDGRGRLITVELLETLNKCGVIKPRFTIKLDEYDKWEKRYLPAKDFGLIVISTSKGIMTHLEAKEKHIGGSLIAYCY